VAKPNEFVCFCLLFAVRYTYILWGVYCCCCAPFHPVTIKWAFLVLNTNLFCLDRIRVFFCFLIFVFFSHQNHSTLIPQIIRFFRHIFRFLFSDHLFRYLDYTHFSILKNFNSHIFVIFRPDDETYLFWNILSNLKCWSNPIRAQ